MSDQLKKRDVKWWGWAASPWIVVLVLVIYPLSAAPRVEGRHVA